MALNQSSVLTAANMKMPIIGLGTWQSSNEEIELAVETALESGYRHIDTAFAYYNEEAIGKCLKKWFSSGKLKREDVFIVSKLPLYANRAEHVELLLKKSLASLQLTYLDLFLIHHPVGYQMNEEPYPWGKGAKLLMDMNTDHVSLWKAMEKQVDEGRTRAIGLSNFNQKQIEKILASCRIKPANLQIEFHIYLQQKNLINFCKKNGITVCGYGPLGSPHVTSFNERLGFSNEGVPSSNLLTDPIVQNIAKKYGKTPAQILIRFVLQNGLATIPKSSKSERIKLNLDVFDFQLNEDDFQKLVSLDRGEEGRILVNGFFAGMKSHPEYPF